MEEAEASRAGRIEGDAANGVRREGGGAADGSPPSEETAISLALNLSSSAALASITRGSSARRSEASLSAALRVGFALRLLAALTKRRPLGSSTTAPTTSSIPSSVNSVSCGEKRSVMRREGCRAVDGWMRSGREVCRLCGDLGTCSNSMRAWSGGRHDLVGSGRQIHTNLGWRGHSHAQAHQEAALGIYLQVEVGVSEFPLSTNSVLYWRMWMSQPNQVEVVR